MKRLLAAGILAGVAVGGTAACTRETSGKTLTVFAAASLTESFTQIGKDFERSHRPWKVRLNLAGSAALATQINNGAPADVFAAASAATMAAVVDAGNAIGTPVVIARNELVIAVAPGNPKKIKTLADLRRPGLKVALCAVEVPCGAAAHKALAAAKVALTPVTLETDVKAALAKVKLGEVDAALVYRTDTLAAADKVDGVPFVGSAAAINDYPTVVLKHADEPAEAAVFVAYLQSGPGRDVLARAGFRTP